jgi:hypothetical protein
MVQTAKLDCESQEDSPSQRKDRDDDADSILNHIPEELMLETAIYSSYLKKRSSRKSWQKRC